MVLYALSLHAQDQMLTKKLQFSIVPGVGTNGLEFARTSNKVSFNLISGHSAYNTVFELSGLSTYTIYQVNGIQLSGLFNVTGGMTLKDPNVKRNEFDGDVYGIQMVGVGNFVKGGGTGAQMSGLVNSINESVQTRPGSVTKQCTLTTKRYIESKSFDSTMHSTISKPLRVKIGGYLKFYLLPPFSIFLPISDLSSGMIILFDKLNFY
jgi:hypothetical protein